ncbi:MAG TPA: hypothetical protein P5244_04210 [Syntrophales bacterium]|jgi:uncharacterized membrane-anchored protein YhcB (DUF1043 family)|nr:hypothetical protein [Syntrophales bacterium]
MEVLFILLAAVIGFAAGALVYRNNAKRLEDELKDVKAKLEKLKGK